MPVPRNFRRCLILVVAILCTGQALAAADPSVDQVYKAARSGQLTRALDMMEQVLRDHPNSAKAHYVMAELRVRQGELAEARKELSIARQLAPGLPFASAESLRDLERAISATPRLHSEAFSRPPQTMHLWGVAALVLVVGAGLGWLLARRRSVSTASYAPSPASMPVNPAAPGTTTGAAPSAGMGIGSGIAGGLATGLAVGAGVAAGEALASRVLNPREREDSPPPAPEPTPDPDDNSMGGDDFGVSGANSWDDDSSSGSDDDWT